MDLYEDEYVRAEVGRHLNALRESQFLTDITIHTAGSPVVAHKIVLATHSSFFRAVCSAQWGSQTGAAQTVALKHIPHDIMLILVDSLYQGRLEIDSSNALSVLSLALELDVQLVRLGAIKFVKSNLSTANVCQALSVACLHLQDDLQRHCVDFVRSVLSSVPQNPTFLEDLYQLDEESFMRCVEPAACALVRFYYVQSVIIEHAEIVLLYPECQLAMQVKACRQERLQPHKSEAPPCELAHKRLFIAFIQDLERFTITLAYLAHNWDARQHMMKPFIQQLPALGTELRRLCVLGCEHGPVQADILRLQQQGSSSCSPSPSCDLQDDAHCHQDQLACAAAVHELLAWPHCSCGTQPAQMQVLARALFFMIEFGQLPTYDQHRIPTRQAVPPDRPRLRDSNGEELCFYDGACQSYASHPLRYSRTGAIDCDVSTRWSATSSDRRPCVFVGGGRDYSWRGSCCGLRYSPGDGTWAAAGPALRDGVTFASVTSIGDTVYMFGNSHPPACSAVCTDSAWRPLPVENFHPGLQFAAVQAVAGEIWVAGGRSLPNKVHEMLYCFRPATQQWRASTKLLTPRYSAASAVLGSQMVISGGQDKARVLGSVEAADVERGWVSWPELPHARKYHSMAAVRRRIYCFGGKRFDSQRLKVVEALDPREGRWQVVGNMFEPRSSFGCAALNGYVYIMGGNDKAAFPMSTVACYDPLMERWSDCSPLPIGISGLSACVVDWHN